MPLIGAKKQNGQVKSTHPSIPLLHSLDLWDELN
jgi:hypothetical protein